MAASTTMLTASCIGTFVIPALGAGTTASGVRVGWTPGHKARDDTSLHVKRDPVLHAHNGALVRIPAIDAVVLARAEVVVFGPLDGAAAQTLGVDLEVGHGRGELLARGGACRLQRRLDHHAGDPAL